MLRIALLGGRAVSGQEGAPSGSKSSKAIALLALLVLRAGRPQSRLYVAATLWPDSTEAQARTNLRRELHHLRQLLGDCVALEVSANELRWNDDESCDVDIRVFATARETALAAAAAGETTVALDQGARAVAAYGGDLLPGMYDDWILEERSVLNDQCAELCDTLARERARSGDYPGAIDAARTRVRLKPLEEVGYRGLMRLYADAGDRAGAVNTYHQCASVLGRELGIEPDRATREELDRVLATSSVDHPEAPSVVHASGLAVTGLVGRRSELTAIARCLEEVSAGVAKMLLVLGDAGVGKTRLLAEAINAAHEAGVAVATTQCFGSSRRLALAPVADWLRSRAVKAATSRLEEIWQQEVERLVPLALPGDGRGLALAPIVETWQRHRFFEGMARALAGVDQTLLLVLDNLQWCDEETLAFLSFLLGFAPGGRILIVATMRPNSPDEEPELSRFVARLASAGVLSEVVLHPLHANESARLASSITGHELSEDERAVFHLATAGYPLFVVEAARSSLELGRGELPGGDLRAVLQSRFEQISETGQEVAGLAAATGQNFTLDLLVEASDFDADTVVRAVDELWRRRLISDVAEGYDFSHDLLRDAAYGRVSPPKRWLLHRRLAQSLELLHADEIDRVAPQLAEQYARAGQSERAVNYLRRAADVATRRFAHSDSIRLHNQALALVRTLPEGVRRDQLELDLLESIGAPLNAQAGYSSVELQQALERAVELATSLGRRDSAIVALVGLWSSQFVQGRIEESHSTAQRALDLAESGQPLGALGHFALGGSLVSLGRPTEALSHLEQGTAKLPDPSVLIVGTRSDVHARAWAAHAHWLLGQNRAALLSAQQAVKTAQSAEQPYYLVVALAYAAVTHQLLGRREGVRELAEQVRVLCDRHGYAYYREWGVILSGWAAGGRLGLETARCGISDLQDLGSLTRMPYWLSLVADLCSSLDDPAGAIAALDAARAGAESRHDVWWLPEVLRRRAAFERPLGRRALLTEAVDLASRHGSTALAQRCRRDLESLRPSRPTRHAASARA